jgi:uncharacterized protein (TIGR02444 family)
MIETPEATNDNPFWDFSLKFYGRGGVASACLELQDKFSADVNILLYSCWVAAAGAEEMEPAELIEIIAAIEPWQSGVVQRLRQIRRDMKQEEMLNLGPLSEGLRQAIKQCELDGEKIEQTILYQSGQNEFLNSSILPVDRAKNAESNLKNYLQAILGDVPADANDLIRKIAQEIAEVESS